MSTLQIFNFNHHELRVLIDDSGNPWFIAKDIAERLGYADAAQAIKDHCKKAINFTNVEKTDVNEIKELSRTRSLIIPESDVYRLVMRSKLESAEVFRDWVVEEVLPSIRKTGEYSASQKFPVPQTFSEALKLAYEQSVVIGHQQKVIEEKDQYIVASNEASIKAGEILVREFVKSNDLIDLGEHQFYDWMREQEIILKESREPYQKYVKLGYFTWKPTAEKHGGKFRYTLRITPRGKIWLARRYLAYLDSELAA